MSLNLLRVGRAAVGVLLLLTTTTVIDGRADGVSPEPDTRSERAAARVSAVRVDRTSACRNVVFVGARGSGEPATAGNGLGAPVRYALDQFAPRMSRGTLGYFPVLPYPAARADFGKLVLAAYRHDTFYPSIDQGVSTTLRFIRSRASRCQHEHYVLAGYSQGGMVVHRTMFWLVRRAADGEALAKSLLRRVDSVIAIADGDRVDDQGVRTYGTAPIRGSWGVIWLNSIGDRGGLVFKPTSADVPNSQGFTRARWFDVCMSRDIVCDLPHGRPPSVGGAIHGDAYKPGNNRYSAIGLPYVRAAVANAVKISNAWLVPPTIATSVLPVATVGRTYSASLGTVDLRRGTWSLLAAQLPAGLTLTTGTGRITGVAAGPTTVVQLPVAFIDTNGLKTQRTVILRIGGASSEIRDNSWCVPEGTEEVRCEYDADMSGDGGFVAYSTRRHAYGNEDFGGDLYLWRRNDDSTVQLTHGNGTSHEPSISADGRYVAFSSTSTDLVPDDTNGFEDVFVLDRETGILTQVTHGDSGSWGPSISADGGAVAFTSFASNLPGHNEGGMRDDIFVWDRGSGAITRLTTDNYTAGEAAISADGRYVAYASEAQVPDDEGTLTWGTHVFVHDRALETRQMAPTQTGHLPAISSGGRYVAFVPDNFPSHEREIQYWDRTTGTVDTITSGRLTGDVDPTPPALSADGRFVTYHSYADEWMDRESVYQWDRDTGTTEPVSTYPGSGLNHSPTASDDGRYVAYTHYVAGWVWDRGN